MRLCLAVGRLDVDRALEELTPTQFDEWLAFNQLEPLGDLKRAERDADLFAVVSSFGSEHPVEPLEVLQAWGYDSGRDPDDDILDEDQTFAAVCMAFGVM